MSNAVDIPTVAHVIQLAVAPVFLLTGIGAILSVLSGRLARVIDRFRVLNRMQGEERTAHEVEIRNLLSRARWIHWAITLCTICALLICIVIAALFIGSELGKDSSSVIAVLFTGAMLALIIGLMCFLREIAIATGVISRDAS
jgi:Protein of unknown function (DUF2721)